MAMNASGRTLSFLSTRLLKSSFALSSSSSASVGELMFFCLILFLLLFVLILGSILCDLLLPCSTPLAVGSDTRVNSI